MFKADNVYVTVSRSGKMGRDHLGDWLENVFFPSVTGDRALLLVDSWSSFTDTEFIQSYAPPGLDFQIRLIPPGTTSLIQPLDVYGFRLWKSYLRYISDAVLLENWDCNLHLRDNIIKIQSLIHNQFSCPRFWETWRNGWWKAGYLEGEGPEFTAPFEFCFESEAAIRMEKCFHCEKRHFITCAWCKATLCFYHFFEDYHYCSTVN